MTYSLLDSYGRWWRMRGNAETTVNTYLNSLRLLIRDVLRGDEFGLLDVDRAMLEQYVERRLQQSVNAANSEARKQARRAARASRTTVLLSSLMGQSPTAALAATGVPPLAGIRTPSGPG
jgi:site-specific recombinase XerD